MGGVVVVGSYGSERGRDCRESCKVDIVGILGD